MEEYTPISTPWFSDPWMLDMAETTEHIACWFWGFTTLSRTGLHFAVAMCCHPVASLAKSSKGHSASGKFSNILPFCVYGDLPRLALTAWHTGAVWELDLVGGLEQWEGWGQVLRSASLPWKEIALREAGYRSFSQGED